MIPMVWSDLSSIILLCRAEIFLAEKKNEKVIQSQTKYKSYILGFPNEIGALEYFSVASDELSSVIFISFNGIFSGCLSRLSDGSD